MDDIVMVTWVTAQGDLDYSTHKIPLCMWGEQDKPSHLQPGIQGLSALKNALPTP